MGKKKTLRVPEGPTGCCKSGKEEPSQVYGHWWIVYVGGEACRVCSQPSSLTCVEEGIV